MRTLKQLAGTGIFRGLPLLLLFGAVGILALLLLVNPQLPVKLGLLLLALFSLLLWWMCCSLERNINASGVNAGRDMVVSATTKYSGMAHQRAGIV